MKTAYTITIRAACDRAYAAIARGNDYDYCYYDQLIVDAASRATTYTRLA